MGVGGHSAGSRRGLRRPPTALPVRYVADDAAADGRVRDVELHRERVVVRRAVRGVRMKLNLPVSDFLGVAIRILPPEGENPADVALVLEHKDPGLALPLFISPEGDELMTQWQAWTQALALPMLVEDAAGLFREAFANAAAIGVSMPCPRRYTRSPLKNRRSKISARRASGRLTPDTPVHRGEREIIARN